MLDLINTYQNEIICVYASGLALSLFIRFAIMTSCVYVSNVTRLKELKNLTTKVASSSLKRSYMSLLWPYELINHFVQNIRYFLKK
jgi:hypothetical protein